MTKVEDHLQVIQSPESSSYVMSYFFPGYLDRRTKDQGDIGAGGQVTSDVADEAQRQDASNAVPYEQKTKVIYTAKMATLGEQS